MLNGDLWHFDQKHMKETLEVVQTIFFFAEFL